MAVLHTSRGLIEKRRISAPDLDEHVVDPKPRLKSDDMLYHAQIIMRRARAENEILRARPEIGYINECVELLRLIHAAYPPAGLLARGERDRLTLAALERADARHGRLSGDRAALRIKAGSRRRQARFIDLLTGKSFVSGLD